MEEPTGVEAGLPSAPTVPAPEPTLASPAPSPPAGPRRVVDVIGGIVLAQLLVLVSGCFMGVLWAGAHREAILAGGSDALRAGMLGDPDFLIMVVAWGQGVTALCAWKLPQLLEATPKAEVAARLGWSDAPVSPVTFLLAFVGTVALGPLVVPLLRGALGPSTGVLKQLEALSLGTSPGRFAALVLVGAIGAGVGEELVFRGYVQRRFVERWGAVAGVALTAVLFGVWHWDVEQGLYAAVLGLWLGFVAVRTGSTVPGALAHLGSNLLSFVATRGAGADAPEPALGWLSVGAAAVCAGCAVALWRRTRAAPAA